MDHTFREYQRTMTNTGRKYHLFATRIPEGVYWNIYVYGIPRGGTVIRASQIPTGNWPPTEADVDCMGKNLTWDLDKASTTQRLIAHVRRCFTLRK